MSKNKLLIIDNYDSFTFILFQYFGKLGCDINVVRNDELTASELRNSDASMLVISPGPGRPESSGISLEAIGIFGEELQRPILGICLGHQCIGHYYGSRIVRAEKVMHGKISTIKHKQTPLFAGVPEEFEATRYHSLVIDPLSLAPELEVTATADDDAIMGVSHKQLQIHGIQFHPESILTTHGLTIIRNFISIAGFSI